MLNWDLTRQSNIPILITLSVKRNALQMTSTEVGLGPDPQKALLASQMVLPHLYLRNLCIHLRNPQGYYSTRGQIA